MAQRWRVAGSRAVPRPVDAFTHPPPPASADESRRGGSAGAAPAAAGSRWSPRMKLRMRVRRPMSSPVEVVAVHDQDHDREQEDPAPRAEHERRACGQGEDHADRQRNSMARRLPTSRTSQARPAAASRSGQRDVSSRVSPVRCRRRCGLDPVAWCAGCAGAGRSRRRCIGPLLLRPWAWPGLSHVAAAGEGRGRGGQG